MRVRRYAFPKRLKLRSRIQYDRVFRRCVRSSDGLFTVLARRNDLDHPRLGTVVSRKSAGNAVQRHRIKRVIRESFRLSHDRLPGVDLVVISRPHCGSADNAGLGASLAAHWQRIRNKCAH